MATGPVTTTTVAALIATLISDRIFLELENTAVMANLVFTDTPPPGIDKISYPFIQKLDAEDITEGTALEGKVNTETVLDIDLDIHKGVPMFITKIAELQTRIKLRDTYARRMAEALGTAIDLTIFALYSGLSQTQGDGSTAITDVFIREAIQLLDEANAPSERFLVIAPSQKNVMLGIDKFVLASESGKNVITTGEFGTIYGVTVIISNNCPVVTTTVKCLMFARDAFGFGLQQDIDTNIGYNVLSVGWDMVADVIYGADEIRDDFAVMLNLLN